MGSSNWPYQSTLQDIEEGRNTLLKELSVKDWLGHACSHCSAGTRSLRHGWQLQERDENSDGEVKEARLKDCAQAQPPASKRRAPEFAPDGQYATQ